MVLPFFAWAITGTFFFIKPGYDKAYEQLAIKSYPLSAKMINSDEEFEEIRWLKSILGTHLIVKQDGKWQQRHPVSLSVLLQPSEDQVIALIEDAIKGKPRYGEIDTVDGNKIETTTGVTISLNWPKLSLYQRGRDTDFIDRMYKIHYLQWTGNKTLDKYLGLIGLLIVVTLALFGSWMVFKSRKRTRQS